MEKAIIIAIAASVLCAVIGIIITSIRVIKLTRRKSDREAAIKARLIAEVRAIHEEAKEAKNKA